MATEKAVITQSHLTDIANAIIAKGGASSPLLPSQMAAAIEAIPTGGGEPSGKSDVNFYTPYGDLVKSFTKDEFITELNKSGVTSLQQIVNMPVLEGLTAQDWNWSLPTWGGENGTKTVLLNQLDKQGKVDIGGMYVTDNGETRLYISIDSEYNLVQPLDFSVSSGGPVVVSWGDGTQDMYSHDVFKTVYHTYPSKGDYIIRIVSDRKTRVLFGVNYDENIFGKNSEIISLRLTKVEIGYNVDAIWQYAFSKCSSLLSITIPRGVTFLDDEVCSECHSLAFFVIPMDITAISWNMFYNCFSVRNVIMPYGIQMISSGAFGNCGSISSIVLPEGITDISGEAISGCSGLETITIPSSVTTIPDLSYCSALKSFTIHSGINEIPNNAFSGCYCLRTINIPNGVEVIGSGAFRTCKSLASIKFPSSIRLIKDFAFDYSGVRIFDFTDSNRIPVLEEINALGTMYDYIVIVPDILYDDWIAAENWSAIKSKIVPD